MSNPQPSRDLDESIDLRRWFEALLRRWQLIAATVTLSVILAIIYSYGFQETVYQSSGGATLPSGSSEDEIGFTPLGYQEFASSTPVMEAVIEDLGLELSAGQLRNQFSFQVNESNFIAVDATAESAEEAFRLASAWIEVYGQQVQGKLQQEFVQRKSNLTEETNLLLADLKSNQESLDEFNLENPAGTMDSHRADLEGELSRSKQRVRDLKLNLIPEAEARLASLGEVSSEEIGTVGGGGSPSSADSSSPGRSAFAPVEEFNSNPVYLELSQDLIRSQLSNLQSELVTSESALRQLTLTDIPLSEAKLVLLKKSLSEEPELLTAPSSGTATPNPVYAKLNETLATTELELETAKKESEILEKKVLVLRQEIGDARSELVLQQSLSEELLRQEETVKEKQTLEANLIAMRKEVTGLEAAIPNLEEQVIELRGNILDTSTARQELESEVDRVSEEYTTKKGNLTSLLRVESNLTSLTALSTIREPSLPAAPLSPNRTRDIMFILFLGLVVGIAVALFWDYYRTQDISPRRT